MYPLVAGTRETAGDAALEMIDLSPDPPYAYLLTEPSIPPTPPLSPLRRLSRLRPLPPLRRPAISFRGDPGSAALRVDTRRLPTLSRSSKAIFLYPFIRWNLGRVQGPRLIRPPSDCSTDWPRREKEIRETVTCRINVNEDTLRLFRGERSLGVRLHGESSKGIRIYSPPFGGACTASRVPTRRGRQPCA